MNEELIRPVADALDALVQTRELEDGRELPADSPGLADRLRQLDHAFWKAARDIVLRAIPETREGGLLLTEAGRRFVDFGLFEHDVLSGVDQPDGEEVDGVWLLHESLNAVMDDVLRRDALDEFQRDLDAVSRDIRLWPDTHLAHIRYRDSKVRELLGDSPRCAHALKLLAEVDEKFEQLKQLELRTTLTDSDRRALSTLRNYVNSRREQLSGLLAPVQERTAVVQTELAAAVLAASEAAEASVGHLIELQTKRRVLENQLLEQQAAARRVTRAEIEKALSSELDSVAALLRLAARYVHATECAVPVPADGVTITQEAAADAAEHLLLFDPRLIDNPLAARFGPPDLLLAPGVGDGVFDATRNRWIVPQRCTGRVISSLAHAAVLYRLNVDSREMSNALLSSYREGIPANSSIRSNLKLRTLLIRDYVAWMTRDAIGEETLSRQTREWFERHIAPDKAQPWLPPEYRKLNARQLAQVRAELSSEAVSADQQHRLGAIEWLLGAGDTDSMLRAATHFDAAEQHDPRHLGGIYSAAVAQMHLKNYQRAIEGFRRFTQASPLGWWSRKAVELCASCR